MLDVGGEEEKQKEETYSVYFIKNGSTITPGYLRVSQRVMAQSSRENLYL